MLNTSFSPWPSFTEEEANAVRDVLLSNKVNYWTGSECREFEKEFASWTESKHAIALANGTVALDVALKALRIGTGDEVIVTCRTFLASVSTIVMAGAKPVFADVDLESQNITAASVRAVLTPSTKAIVCVHLAGWPCDMDSIMDVANEYGLFVIEDCAQAHGACYKGRPVGSIGHVGAWSFCQDKIMTTGGEGGMVTTNDPDLWGRMWTYKDHGKSWEAVYERYHPPGFRWLHESFGTNWRMTEMQAVIGRIQLRRMSDWHRIRTINANRILDAASNVPAYCVPDVSEGVEHAWYKCYIFVREDALKPDWSRDRIMHEITDMEVPCYSGICPEVYMEKAFDDTCYRPEERLVNARKLGDTSLMFLVHPTLTDDEMSSVCNALVQVGQRASM
ncbi:DegT/DnrJ/EryC1/StrS family aminotransferase [Desulfoluna butyratoxydans]|uniref:Pyridoxal phosphate-dependent transferase n=1 Tax=Desulfoluna butyratoxydans TaxID=231438 RepID=A0A4U8YU30_9BACT|nr:DegT/DnrJ/EryC1/StrS aminotransferase family protein [Desulfoluna butyratoxydans]VFQ47471.1 pyridoxal phosphate-dependent transferase [Desulfoluna butyratoxydans]